MASRRLPTPARWLSTPVNNMARVGEQEAAAWKLAKRVPRSDSALRCGVSISPPKAPRSVNPQSSATSTTRLGRPAAHRLPQPEANSTASSKDVKFIRIFAMRVLVRMPERRGRCEHALKYSLLALNKVRRYYPNQPGKTSRLRPRPTWFWQGPRQGGRQSRHQTPPAWSRICGSSRELQIKINSRLIANQALPYVFRSFKHPRC